MGTEAEQQPQGGAAAHPVTGLRRVPNSSSHDCVTSCSSSIRGSDAKRRFQPVQLTNGGFQQLQLQQGQELLLVHPGPSTSSVVDVSGEGGS